MESRSLECMLCKDCNGQIVSISCGHSFHGSCILKRQLKERTCPLCPGTIDGKTYDDIKRESKRNRRRLVLKQEEPMQLFRNMSWLYGVPSVQHLRVNRTIPNRNAKPSDRGI